MLRGVYTSASGMIVQSERLNTISNNLANVDTNGFKKDEMLIRAFPEMEIFRKDDEKIITPFENTSKLTPIGNLGTGAKIEDIYTEFTQGRVVRTDTKTDFAIIGEEFFMVETKSGLRLTKDGGFTIDANRYLVTMSGDKVLGRDRNGRYGYIKTEDNKAFEAGVNGELRNITIEGDMNIEKIPQNATAKEGFLNVAVTDKTLLLKEGQNYYSFDNTPITLSDNPTINQGFLEGSNVAVVKEMVEMIECSRAYETNQKILTSQDEVVAKIVNEVGRWA